MVNWQSIFSCFDTEGTLVKWLKKVEKAIGNSGLVSIDPTVNAAGMQTIKAVFADHSEVVGECDLSEVFAKAEDVTTALTNLMHLIESHQIAIENIESDLGDTEQRVDALETAQASLDGRVGDLETEVQGIHNDIQALQAEDISLGSRTGALESSVGSLSTRVSAAENDINGLSTRVSSAESDIATQGGRLSLAESDILRIDTAEQQDAATIAAQGLRLSGVEGVVSSLSTNFSALTGVVATKSNKLWYHHVTVEWGAPNDPLKIYLGCFPMTLAEPMTAATCGGYLSRVCPGWKPCAAERGTSQTFKLYLVKCYSTYFGWTGLEVSTPSGGVAWSDGGLTFIDTVTGEA